MSENSCHTGITKFSSGKGRAYEWADKEHGVFSYYLLQGLRGQSVNDKGQVTITDLAN